MKLSFGAFLDSVNFMATVKGTPSAADGKISVTVELSGKGGNNKIILDNLPVSTTVGELKKQLKTEANARLGRANKFENWDNRRSLSDYFVGNGEQLNCVIQCSKEDGQSSFDDYDESLASRQQ